jgi:hypothetical protein
LEYYWLKYHLVCRIEMPSLKSLSILQHQLCQFLWWLTVSGGLSELNYINSVSVNKIEMLWQWPIGTATVFLDRLDRPIFFYLEHNVSKTGCCFHLLLGSVQLGPTDRNSLYLRTPAATQTKHKLQLGISLSQGLHLHTEQHKQNNHTDMNASNGIRTHDPSVWACEDSSFPRPSDHYDRLD